MSDLSELLAKSPLFSNNIMGNKVTAQSQVNVMMNHFGVVADSDPTSPGSQAERFFTNKISAEVGFSAIVNEVANFLSTDNVPTEFAEVAALLDNKALVSKAYVETNPPDDFALTTEIGNLVGSSGNDIFIGDKNTTSVADTLVGGDGKNILQLSSANIAPNNSSRIEKVLYTTPDGDISVADFSDVNSVQGRSMTLLANGDYSYTPAAGFFGSDSFDYIVNDGNDKSDIGTVNITVNEIGAPPSPVEIIVDNQDSSQTSISGSWTPSSGTGPHAGNSVYANSNGESFTWGPDLSPNGVHEIAAWWTYWNNRDESVTYEVHHAGGVTNITVNQKDQALDSQWNSLGSYTFDQASFVRVVHDGGASTTTSADALRFSPSPSVTNTPPVAVDDAAVTDEDMTVSGNVLGNDADADGDTLNITAGVVASTQDGSVTLLANGDYSYTPAVGFFGADSFDYIVNDGNGASDIGTVNITVNEISSPPAPVEIIVDNQDGSQTSITGSWTPSSGTDPHAGNSVYANANGESFKWDPDVSANGVYEIAAWWTYWNNRDESVTYEVHHVGGVTNITVNQRNQSLDSQWNSLGSYTFDQASFVRVVHDGGTSTTTSADALRFSPVIEPGILDKYTSGSNDGSGFNIEINFEGTWTVELQQDFIASSEFLSDTIVGDLADVFFGGKVIDDIRIDATLEKIDGVGGVLGQAGATAIRTSNSLPATAIMEFDIADATNFNALDLWDDIILHEMTHSIGFSSGIWELIGGLITGNNTSNPLFTGASAISVYKSILLDPTGIIGVPLEVGEGAGTDFSHWDEETFDDELMTGFINSSNVYSDMTVAALEDMGYDTVLFDSSTFL